MRIGRAEAAQQLVVTHAVILGQGRSRQIERVDPRREIVHALLERLDVSPFLPRLLARHQPAVSVDAARHVVPVERQSELLDRVQNVGFAFIDVLAAELAVESVDERVAHAVDTSAGTGARLEDANAMTGLVELGGGRQPGEPGAEDLARSSDARRGGDGKTARLPPAGRAPPPRDEAARPPRRGW